MDDGNDMFEVESIEYPDSIDSRTGQSSTTVSTTELAETILKKI